MISKYDMNTKNSPFYSQVEFPKLKINQEIKFNHSNLTNNSFSKRDGIFEVNKPLFNQVDSDTHTKSNILNKINN